jgi:hypothetical protein
MEPWHCSSTGPKPSGCDTPKVRFPSKLPSRCRSAPLPERAASRWDTPWARASLRGVLVVGVGRWASAPIGFRGHRWLVFPAPRSRTPRGSALPSPLSSERWSSSVVRQADPDHGTLNGSLSPPLVLTIRVALWFGHCAMCIEPQESDRIEVDGWITPSISTWVSPQAKPEPRIV